MTTGSTINNAIKRRPHSYGEVLSSFGEENMKTLSQLKRYMECLQGDKKFRAASDTGDFTPDQRNYLKEVGVTFEPEELSFMWERPEAMNEIYQQMGEVDDYEELSEEAHALLSQAPLLEIWIRFDSTYAGDAAIGVLAPRRHHRVLPPDENPREDPP